jgi:RNA polymerase sigma factor (sigma-70 family)
MAGGRTMQTTQDYDSLTDDQLIELSAVGDQSAFAAIFERFFDGVYDFALRITRDPAAAAAAVFGTFADAWDGLQRGRGGGHVTAWLFAHGRDRGIIESRRRRRPSGNGTAPDSDQTPRSYARPDPDRLATPAVVEDSDLAETVWAAAAALTPRQYALLDMHLRRGLTAEQIAEGLQIPPANAYTMLTRLRNGLYEAVTYQLLMTRGRRECAELDTLLARMRATVLTRRSQLMMRNHLKTCAHCRGNRRKYPSPLAVFAGLSLIPADPEEKVRVWQNVSAHLQGITQRKPFMRRAAPLDHTDERSGMPYLAAGIAGVVALLAILLAAVLVFTSGGGDAALSDPENVRPLDRELADSSTDNVIEVQWDPKNNVQGYSVTWSEDPEEFPDTTVDLAGTTTRTESPTLDPGIWYFHLRTQGTDGSWTSTVHLGPFEVLSPDDRPDRTPSPTPASPTTTTSPTPVLTPNFRTPPPPPPPPTPAPTPEPTAAPTPEPTPAPTPAPTAPPTSTPPPVTPTPTPP